MCEKLLKPYLCFAKVPPSKKLSNNSALEAPGSVGFLGLLDRIN